MWLLGDEVAKETSQNRTTGKSLFVSGIYEYDLKRTIYIEFLHGILEFL